MFSYLYKQNLFTLLTQFLVIILPFYVLISLYLTNIVGIPKAGFFIKEWVLVLLFGSLIFEYIRNKKKPHFDLLDYSIFAFIVYGIVITFVNGLWLKSIIFGGRYDFMFLIVLLIYKHGAIFLQCWVKKILTMFLWSGWIALLLSFIVKFRLGENILIQFGYVMYKGNWIFDGWVPAYHGLEWSWIRRFQWILDNPNAMWYFLILFGAIFLYMQKKKLEYSVFLISFFLLILVILTYSRSALLWILTATGLVFLLHIKYLYTHHKKYFIPFILFSLLFVSIFWVLFQDKIKHIVLRTSSTNAHFERMAIGIERFIEKPLGAGLAESWPAFRSIYPEKTTKEDEEYYIPESWFIQILIEGGIVYFILFISIFIIILYRLFLRSYILFAMLVAILIMNIFLHIFEATYISILTFLIIWLFINKK